MRADELFQMVWHVRRVFLFVVVLFSLFAMPVWAAEELPLQDIVAVTADGAKHLIHAEIAVTDSQHAQGLMFRTEMAEDHGMLFVFPAPRPLGFWMRNTLIPLDMIFIREDGLIHHIHKNAKPQDDTVIMSQGPVSHVLELNGGAAERIGLKEGNRLYNETYFGNKLAE